MAVLRWLVKLVTVTAMAVSNNHPQIRHTYANEPPRWVLANVALRAAAVTHALSSGAGELFTVTAVTAPAGDTLTEAVTFPRADDWSWHPLVSIWAMPAATAERSRLSGNDGASGAGATLPPACSR